MTRIAVATVALVALLALAPAASAIYIVTPLHLRVSADRVEVGDEVRLVITPAPDWEGDTYAGKTLVIRYHYDPNEKPASAEESTVENGTSSPAADEPVSSDDTSSADDPYLPEQREIGRVTLDGKSSATFTWTIPAELDDHNAFLSVANATDSEDSLAFANVGVGDAPPVMAILAAESGPAPDEPQGGAPEPGEPTSPPVTATADDTDADAGSSNVPAPGVLALVAGLGAAALIASRRR